MSANAIYDIIAPVLIETYKDESIDRIYFDGLSQAEGDIETRAEQDAWSIATSPSVQWTPGSGLAVDELDSAAKEQAAVETEDVKALHDALSAAGWSFTWVI